MEEKNLTIETAKAHYSVAGRMPGSDKEGGFFARVQEFTGRFGVEQRGIERVLPHERTDTSMSKIGTLVRTNLTASKREG